MGLFDGIEKLINDHGSAVILKERIELANDKYSALEQKVIKLEAENKILQLNLEKAEIEIKNLKKLTEGSLSNDLEEIKQELLCLLAGHDGITAIQISRASEKSDQLILFHLTELENLHYVHGSYSSIDDTEWYLAQEGRGYLVRHGLLK